MDSVTAVVAPLLGGQQREGEWCGRAQGWGLDLASRFWSPVSGQPGPRCPAAHPLCFFFPRLGLDDAAGPRAEDSGPGPQRGTGGEEVDLASHPCLTSGPWASPSGEIFFLVTVLYFP